MTPTNADNQQSTAVLSAGEQSPEKGNAQSPVFILDILPGEESRLLADVLLNHKSLQAPAGAQEDYIMENAHLVLEYLEKTRARWKGLPWIEKPEVWRDELLGHFSDGILEFLTGQMSADKRLLCRSAAVSNVDKFFELFPLAKVLIVVRDGRDAVESAAVGSPNKPQEVWTQQWADGARAVLNFMQASKDLRGKSWQLVKYEDLLERPEAMAADLLSFLQLNPGDFAWDRLQKPTARTPSGAWKEWGWSRKRSFKKAAGQELIRLGYVADDEW